jgi:hypothetical protein
MIDFLGNPAAKEAHSIFDAIRLTQVSGLPPLSLSLDSERGTVSFEWILEDRRLGFICDSSPEDSSWFFVRGWGRRSSSGPLSVSIVVSLLSAFLKDEDVVLN